LNDNLKIRMALVTLGFGVNTCHEGMSVDVYFAGCSMEPKCPGCQNPELWSDEAGFDMTLASLKNYIKSTIVDGAVRHVVFMGGEPLDQQKAVFLAAKWAKEEYGLKTWLYTGHDYKGLPNNIKSTFDVIVSGRYDETQLNEPGAFPASKNQEVHYGRN